MCSIARRVLIWVLNFSSSADLTTLQRTLHAPSSLVVVGRGEVARISSTHSSQFDTAGRMDSDICFPYTDWHRSTDGLDLYAGGSSTEVAAVVGQISAFVLSKNANNTADEIILPFTDDNGLAVHFAEQSVIASSGRPAILHVDFPSSTRVLVLRSVADLNTAYTAESWNGSEEWTFTKFCTSRDIPKALLNCFDLIIAPFLECATSDRASLIDGQLNDYPRYFITPAGVSLLQLSSLHVTP